MQIPTSETLEWMRPILGPEPRRILEVGCGDGEVAAALALEGHTVVAFDSNQDCVDRARARGVEAFRASFPDLDPKSLGPRFEIVFFGRVLHHLASLPEVVELTASILRPGGLVLVEDFAWEKVDEATAAWVLGTLRLGRDLGQVPADEWDWELPPLQAWRAPFVDHELHPGEAMIAALSERFDIDAVTRAPYAYRWFDRYSREAPGGADWTPAILGCERYLIKADSAVPIGLRVVARLAPPNGRNQASDR